MRRLQPLATLWLTNRAGPRTVAMRRGWIHNFRSRTQARRILTPSPVCTFCRAVILQFLPPAGYASIVDSYEKALAAGRRIAGVCPPGAYWSDLRSES